MLNKKFFFVLLISSILLISNIPTTIAQDTSICTAGQVQTFIESASAALDQLSADMTTDNVTATLGELREVQRQLSAVDALCSGLVAELSAPPSGVTVIPVAQGSGAEKDFWQVYFTAPTGSRDFADYIGGP